MKGFYRLGILLLVLLALGLSACGRAGSKNPGERDWQVLQASSITRPRSQVLPDGAHLFQSAEELEKWAQRYGLEIATAGIDFAKQSVAILVRPYGTFQLQVKGVEVADGKAEIVLTPDSTKPLPIPELRPGFEIRQYIVLQLPKVEAVTITE